ncbi:hypothetical protein E2562_015457 [Oryza meyeriana var. granulata]|uniref:Uncharacterized protein n=1 Tax=Oryza meyeriana var. granulata TaxID=110450 RepID=A0A6G1BYD8_9ORYZ|nr:hypothetical protein E2562_015457 [Oryza meyeriana var. granulata]
MLDAWTWRACSRRPARSPGPRARGRRRLLTGARAWRTGLAGCLAVGPASGAGLDARSRGRAAGGWPGGQDLEGAAAAWRRSTGALRGCAQATGHGSRMRERERPGVWSGGGPGG